MRESKSGRAMIVNEVITGCKCRRMKCGMEGQMQGRLESPRATSERANVTYIERDRVNDHDHEERDREST
jgi:hypothetical protein